MESSLAEVRILLLLEASICRDLNTGETLRSSLTSLPSSGMVMGAVD